MNEQAPHTCFAQAKERRDDPFPVMTTKLLWSKQRGQTVTGKNTITLTQHDRQTDRLDRNPYRQYHQFPFIIN